MKNSLLLTLIACAILSPLAISAQKKTAAKKVSPIKEITLKTAEDSISYALGASMVQNGLKGYLQQMGVLADTANISSDYATKIANEKDASKIAKLESELKFKKDSIDKANTKSLDEFLSGFSQTLNQDKSKSSYNAGVAIGSQISSATERFSGEVLGEGKTINMDAFVAAFTSSLKDEKMLIENTDDLVQNAAMKAQQANEAKKAEDLKAQYATQIAEGDQFMAENKTKDGVIALPNGLQYKVITMGTGEIPTASDRVTVHYKGTLLDGTVFDSSIDRGEPATFGVGQVIKGWTEALLLMPVGSKWILYIPYDLAYGSRDQGTIKPFSNLIFEVELIDIAK
ncbi:FKBP-type peptidyl-prolyl cis-trans isomerase FklB [Dysgonomonas hofstadii]|uniref:peptidylprolyl isomerase n=1 Tax=Dysgonomonas hofstadii TaxID=637886 RepID=A0A840CLY5_9BACT|nr:FKBP-type peptidyl-prolyl cis-trans isomerase [Dysgonomonas hofstadii]MBB4034484.1 FKBP-type peptidyl-prolyl cis-trans isomerase FklB [Dysgonomonas hofstadii]